ncbi:uncharacterized protein LOC129938713 isoform X2 [Eupeodes corollae]|nr:uncharacterized protein LOC129938713 isoform X2 [Eupeodes corollae]XP_055902392.1 uncharacterized protein LOC129938713 isoform X2 [Eupeodes corollae]XP_055902393.1 uncharacterized protein LOC129938713 isoform X2 [Eupeodes corollae]XP_055902394.1 uncharacterized protein LOC129938713 isoform X2 [Eupeodes corollae]XP_055902395.1 uncharacterized protein LOC129938713 isoform X2 [Eupeodes corollae]XP_055902397.1 uncharacterized protein LOC129938713 isoform X2 [Eupeodes corollae]XP_055902398.1 un
MDLAVPQELEELILCSCCLLPFNETDALPKLLTCRHYFCLKCVNSILQKGSELYCMHCWKRTEIPGPEMKPDNLPTYGAILFLTKNMNMLSISKPKISSGKQRSSSSTSSVNSNNGGACSGGNTTNGNSNSTTASGNSCSSKSNSDPKLSQTASTKIKKGENCMTHAMPNTLWCTKCGILVCRACAASEDHRNHLVKSQVEAKETIQTDIANELFSMQKTLNDVQHLVLKQRDFLLKILESCTALKTQIETELINHVPTLEIAEIRESLCKAKICLDMLDNQSPADALKLYTTLNLEKQRLISRYQEMFLQCKLDDLIRNFGMVFDFDLIKQALVQLHSCVISGGNLDSFGCLTVAAVHHNPVLLLANYCISQLYSRHVLTLKQKQIRLSNNSSGYFQSNPHTFQSQNTVPQQSNHSSQSPQNDGIAQAKTYADITTSSPKSSRNHHHASNTPSKNGFENHRIESLGPVAPPNGIRVPATPPGAFPTNDFNAITVPTMTMIHMQQKHHSKQVHKSNTQQQQSNPSASLLLNPNVHVYPIYFFDIDMNAQTIGRILIEVRNDVAPKMANNFGALATHEVGFGYKGCQIFQCWENESIITGDFELNNGRGGRSVFEEHFFMPDDTKILAIRGSVGMRRSQKRHDNMGLVGSQFRVILREMRGFTGIFAFVVDGLELIEKISQTGDSAGKPQSNVVIQNCGKYQ